MKDKISILHISDLHKHPNGNFNNLMESLKSDCDNYTQNDSIEKPNIVVVSGDLIRGGSEAEIKSQYFESNEFLNNIVDYFLDGKKERIIIIPGNHDIDWNASRSSMYKVDLNDINSLVSEYFNGDSTIRWSWKDLCFYRITDSDKYSRRLDSFIEFYNSFYEGIYIYSNDLNYQFQIYDYPEFNIAFIGLNSCFNNDHLNNIGRINPVCNSNGSQNLKKLHAAGRLLVGVWHHHTSGMPSEDNYLDGRILRAMIDLNIKIGLHGHQHVCGAVNEYKNIFEEKKMVIFSAGTLYGTKLTLPNGASRQYNIIEINSEGDENVITLHSREDVDNNLFEIPNWNKGRINKTYKSSWSTRIKKPEQPSVEEILSKIMQNTEVTGKLREGIKDLCALNINNPFVRKILIDYLKRLGDDQLICEILFNPQNSEESILLMNSAMQIQNIDLIQKVLDIPLIKNSNDPATKHFYQLLKTQSNSYGKN